MRAWAIAAGLLAVASGCHPVPDEDRPASAPALRAGLSFSYGTTDGGVFDSRQTLGRVTAVLFVTTFDMASQVLAARLDEALHRHRPRINAGAVVLEAPKYAPLADAFRESLRLTYPVAIADGETLAGQGPFGRIARVPTIVILDAQGREVFRKAGMFPPAELEQALDSAAR